MSVGFHASEGELQDQIFQLKQEKHELEEYADRVTRELRRYQQSRPPPQGEPESDLPLPPWATNMKMMSPLLYAYEERIAELEAIIERSSGLAEQAQALARQNDSLRAELHAKTERLRNVHAGMPAEDANAGVEQDELRELYRISMEQNEALAQQNQLLKLQMERMQQSLSIGQQQNQELQARLVEGSEALNAECEHANALTQAEGTRMVVLYQEREAAERRIMEVTGELVEEVRSRDDLEAQLDRTKRELQLKSQNFDLQKKRLTEKYTLTEDEEARLKGELGRALQVEKDLRQRVMVMDRELAETSSALYTAQQDGEAARQDAERMLQIIDVLERKLAHIDDSHSVLQSKLHDHETHNEQLLLEKERWLSVEQSMRRQAERLENKVHSESELFRQRLHVDVETFESVQRRKVTELLEQLRRTEQVASESHTQLELAEKQRSWEVATAERHRASFVAERSRLESDLEDVHQARLRAERRADIAKQELSRAQADLASRGHRD
mmetsp:Transcript_54507/g.100851  ORF Transcript_54507/g.100851 Transcript_54507/m.100851 type:complete len:502 (+) Transcript_54507:65-1570(+)